MIASHLRNATCIVLDLLCLWPAQMCCFPGLAKGSQFPVRKTFPAHVAGSLELEVLLNQPSTNGSARVLTVDLLDSAVPAPKPYLGDHYLGDHSNLTTGWSTSRIDPPSETSFRTLTNPDLQPSPQTHPQEVDPLYLFACHLAWEQAEEPSAAWELLAAARSSSRRHPRPRSCPAGQFPSLGRHRCGGRAAPTKRKRFAATETDMNATLWPRHHRQLQRMH